MATNALKNNNFALRACILYEVASKKSIYECYKKFCRMLGDDAMEYQEIEFWFQRFSSGKFELDYDRSLDPETRSFSDLPIQVFHKILMKIEPTDRFVIRKVSQNFRDIIDSWDPGFKSISIHIYEFSAYILYDDHQIAYRSLQLPIMNPIGCEVENGDRIKRLFPEMPGDIAFNDVANVLNNPKLQLDQLVIDCQRFTREFEEKIQTVGRKQNVGCIVITTNYNQGRLVILYFLKPETANLVSPRVYIHFESSNHNENRRMRGRESEDGQQICQFIMTALESTKLEFLEINSKRTFDTKPVRKYLKSYKEPITDNSDDHKQITYLYTASTSNRQFRIKLTKNCITIERI